MRGFLKVECARDEDEVIGVMSAAMRYLVLYYEGKVDVAKQEGCVPDVMEQYVAVEVLARNMPRATSVFRAFCCKLCVARSQFRQFFEFISCSHNAQVKLQGAPPALRSSLHYTIRAVQCPMALQRRNTGMHTVQYSTVCTVATDLHCNEKNAVHVHLHVLHSTAPLRQRCHGPVLQ